jgi:hypothetical protein
MVYSPPPYHTQGIEGRGSEFFRLDAKELIRGRNRISSLLAELLIQI